MVLLEQKGLCMKLNDVKVIEEVLGYKFKNIDLIITAFTHKSYSSSNNYERLEFVGDRVLGICVSKILYTKYPTEKEGDLGKRFAKLVSKEYLSMIFDGLNLCKFIMVGDDKKIVNNSSVKADVLEAIFGAVNLDSNYDCVEVLIKKLFDKHINNMEKPHIDNKTKLQEWLQKRKMPLPIYECIDNLGLEHAPKFLIELRVDGYESIRSIGMSKRMGQQNCADEFLKKYVEGG